ncbi:hypothetical protein EYF80_006621 [Liparis tanakae]|uniref:Uncharacterized protein n=1 Tax=Liparis tanakae TaxID=230148 RepID=A0A4Z2IZN0_9TELE|nr:hypothetical protein EYF80_006621 [Liparis tanakae]
MHDRDHKLKVKDPLRGTNSCLAAGEDLPAEGDILSKALLQADVRQIMSSRSPPHILCSETMKSEMLSLQVKDASRA